MTTQSKHKLIYLDNNATTRTLDCVAEAMIPFLTERFQNSSSAIAQFCGVRQEISRAKWQICKALTVNTPDQLIITSGATESNNLAIAGAAKANLLRRQIIMSAIEHPSVLETAESLREEGYRVSVLPVDPNGVVRHEMLGPLLSPDTLLVSIMLANNETGVIQPLPLLAQIVKDFDPQILVHTDATQAVGKIPVNLEAELAGVDLLSLSAHKFHGPKGVGALYIRDSEAVCAILHGGGQQGGKRSGTENPASIIGMAAAIVKLAGMEDTATKIRNLAENLESGILSAIPSAFVLGAGASRLPNTLSICIPGIDAEALVDQMASRNIAISSGSACSYGAQRPSHVAVAMGLPHEQAKSCIRISLSVESTQTEVNLFLEAIIEILSTDSLHVKLPADAIS